MSEIIESQQEELHCAQAEELQRRDQQLLHAQLLQQNSKLREVHVKSLNEMERIEAISKGLHSMDFREEDWSKIKTLSFNSRPEFRNYRLK